MKGTETFKATIQAYLNKRASEDPLFAETLKKENKNIDDCITYILNEVQKSGCNGFADEEIYNMAVHYYDEDNIKPGKAVSGRVVVNHKVEITAEEKAQAKQAALDKIIEEQKAKLLKRETKKADQKKPEKQVTEQASLF